MQVRFPPRKAVLAVRYAPGTNLTNRVKARLSTVPDNREVIHIMVQIPRHTSALESLVHEKSAAEDEIGIPIWINGYFDLP